MGLLEIASSKPVWRGIEYYKSNNALSWEQTDNGVYDGLFRAVVAVSGGRAAGRRFLWRKWEGYDI